MQDKLRAMLREIHSRGIDVVMLGAPQPSLMGVRADPMYALVAREQRVPLDDSGTTGRCPRCWATPSAGRT